ncbi:MAG: hypothetical protein KAJ19_07225 [Gammaproteobacteria bacterium]|nr:hypothetical protein [Gammaproteobacteria bacterium]
MAVGPNTYGTVAGVERLIGDLVDNRTFGVGTVPTLVQAEAELDNAAAEINARLDAAGYSAPVVNADYPFAYAYLKAANEYGAAARLLSTVPSEVYSDDEDVVEAGPTRVQTYASMFNKAIKVIDTQKLRATRWRAIEIEMGSRYDDAGNEKLPMFTRDQDNYPGTRPLVK